MGGFEQAAMVVRAPPMKREEGMQESDLLDMLPDGKAKENSGTDHIMLVSLGCYCGPKLSFKHIGRGAETLPFDWMRTRGSGILKFMREDFDGFFDFDSKKPVPGCNMTTYRGYYHSFWHDDPSDPGMRTRYGRRIARFKSMEQSEQPILFVRTIPTTDELAQVPELLEEIVTRYGKKACLLIVVDFQATAPGPAIVTGLNNLLVYFLTGSHHVAEDGSPAPPYGKPVLCALDWMIGKPIEAMRFPDMAKVSACADETHWGLEGLGGLGAFEREPPAGAAAVGAARASPEAAPHASPREDRLEVLPAGAKPSRPAPLPSADLEARLGRPPVAAVDSDGVVLVSLGCSPATKMTLQEMGRGCEELPFDWLQVSHEGLIHFLYKGLDAPIREGLGAGGQRPSERHGYLDVATRLQVQGRSLPVCRSHLHSFWHDDLGEPSTRAALAQRVANWDRLGARSETLLFVRAAATAAELGRADELLGALTKRFGPQACLLLIADFQNSSSPGPLVIEGYDDLLVYFLEGSAHEDGSAAAPYRRPIECALDWVRGEPLEASSVENLELLQRVADPTNWGLAGPGGLPAFEGAGSPLPEVGAPGGPACSAAAAAEAKAETAAALAENAWLEEAKLEVEKDSFAMFSLGCQPGVAAALSLAGHGGAEEGPFDTMHVRMEGVVHFLLTSFRDFFEVSSEQRIPGTSLTMRRSANHSFLDEFPEETWQMAYQKVIDNWFQLSKSSRPKLFVHAITDTSELDQVSTLLEELMALFGRQILLAVIVGGQEHARMVSIEGHFGILVHFIAEPITSSTDPGSYVPLIKSSLDWAVGRPTKAAVVQSASALRELAVPASADLYGPGGLPVFEESLSHRGSTSSAAGSAMSAGAGKAGVGNSINPLKELFTISA